MKEQGEREYKVSENETTDEEKKNEEEKYSNRFFFILLVLALSSFFDDRFIILPFLFLYSLVLLLSFSLTRISTVLFQLLGDDTKRDKIHSHITSCTLPSFVHPSSSHHERNLSSLIFWWSGEIERRKKQRGKDRKKEKDERVEEWSTRLTILIFSHFLPLSDYDYCFCRFLLLSSQFLLTWLALFSFYPSLILFLSFILSTTLYWSYQLQERGRERKREVPEEWE